MITERLVAKLLSNCCHVFSVVCEDTCQWMSSYTFILLLGSEKVKMITFPVTNQSPDRGEVESVWSGCSLPPVSGKPDCSDPFEVHLQFPDFVPLKG